MDGETLSLALCACIQRIASARSVFAVIAAVTAVVAIVLIGFPLTVALLFRRGCCRTSGLAPPPPVALLAVSE
ncbi:hypothetical protein AWV80_27830 [Cupriavidus sp. UYMU48A]|nr:hypothetical protein AWV80_27830 [Cupriavidus sp. UYMU48A]